MPFFKIYLYIQISLKRDFLVILNHHKNVPLIMTYSMSTCYSVKLLHKTVILTEWTRFDWTLAVILNKYLWMKQQYRLELYALVTWIWIITINNWISAKQSNVTTVQFEYHLYHSALHISHSHADDIYINNQTFVITIINKL